MNVLANLTVNIEEYKQRTEWDKENCWKLALTLLCGAIFFLVASVAALFFDAPNVAGVLFLVSIFNWVESIENRLEIRMLEANWGLARLINQHTNDLQAIRSHLGIVEEEEGDSE